MLVDLMEMLTPAIPIPIRLIQELRGIGVGNTRTVMRAFQIGIEAFDGGFDDVAKRSVPSPVPADGVGGRGRRRRRRRVVASTESGIGNPRREEGVGVGR